MGFASVNVYLKGTDVIADAGTLLWYMPEKIEMTSSMYGGCWQSCYRTCANESCCLNRFSADDDGAPALAGFGNLLPGDLVGFGVSENVGWVLSQGAFVVGTDNIAVTARFAGCCAAAASGEGAFLTKVKLADGEDGPGSFFAGGYGGINRHQISVNQSFMIDNGMFFAGPHKLRIGIARVGGWKSCFFSGEGLVMVLTGPCIVFTQNRDPSIFTPPESEGENGAS